MGNTDCQARRSPAEMRKLPSDFVKTTGGRILVQASGEVGGGSPENATTASAPETGLCVRASITIPVTEGLIVWRTGKQPVKKAANVNQQRRAFMRALAGACASSWA